MKFLRYLILSVAFLVVMTGTALATAGLLYQPTQNSAEVKDILMAKSGSCSIVFDAEGDELVLEEDPETCASLKVGDTVIF